MSCKLIHWWIKNKQNCKVQLCIGILNWFQIRSELQTLYREEIRQVTKTNSNHFFCCFFFLFWGVDFVIFDLFSSLGHSYFLMILRIQHISFVFSILFFGEISKVLEIDSREESLFEEILCEKQRHLTGDFGTVKSSCGLILNWTGKFR